MSEPQKEVEKPDISKFINMETAKTLQQMGYSKNVSEKACLFSQSNIDKALDWITEHQNDPDFEEEAKIEINPEQPKGPPSLDPEEAKAKARELQEKMRKMHEEKQKQIEEEHEKMRIHNTKEMLKAQRAEEERQAQIFLRQKKKEDEEKEKARREILEQIARDKAERAGKKYVPGQFEQEQKISGNIHPIE